jgi:beta-mannosidase
LPASDELRRSGIGLDTDDGSWPEQIVPGHWRNNPAFADHDGPLLHRRRFTAPPPEPGRRRWITLDGIFYQADVWLDGAYLGDPEGYFFAHTFDVTALSRLGDDHVLAIEVACNPEQSQHGRRNITGVFQYWDGIDRTWNPGGLWRTVRLHDTGPVRIERCRVLCRDADETRAHLLVHAELDSDDARQVTVRTLVDGDVHAESTHRLARGVNEVTWAIDIAEPALWWPRSLGDQPLVEVAVDVDVDGVPSDRSTRRTGLRHVAWNDWTCSVNGERLYLKGANLLPTRAAIGEATDAEIRRDVDLAAEAGLDALRVHGHIAPRATYDRADELGILLLQDFPLQWGYARSVRGRAVAQARIAVDEYGHHPSIVQWSAHNDPTAVAIGIDGDHPMSRLRFAAAHQLPTWNKTVLDRWVKRSFERADPTRLTVPHSGVLPHLPLLDGTDSHLYFGWYHGQVDDLARLARTIPRLVRFVSEFGAQAVPDDCEFIDATAWPDLDWDDLAIRHGMQKWVFDEHVPPAAYASFDAWRTATQEYQAMLVRRQIEVLRRLKYRPTGGFCVFALNDPAPMVSWSLLDHERRPKPGWSALVDACRPVIVVAETVPTRVEPGQRLRLDIHVVNDHRTTIEPATIDVTVRWGDGERRWRFGGRVDADDCTFVGRIEFDVPDAGRSLEVDLELTTERTGTTECVATNRYRSTIGERPVPPERLRPG